MLDQFFGILISMKRELPLLYIDKSDLSIHDSFRDRACGVICSAMVLKTLNKDFKSVGELIKLGRGIGAYREGVGWTHEGLVQILNQYEVSAKCLEFRKKNLMRQYVLNEAYVEDIIYLLDRGKYVIVSVDIGFSTNKSTHLIVVHGYKKIESDICWYIADSSHSNKRKDWVSDDVFRKFFRGLCIVVG